MKDAVWISDQGEKVLQEVYSQAVRDKLSKEVRFLCTLTRKEEMEAQKEFLSSAEYIFTTWGMFSLQEEEIRSFFPALKAVFYAAGSVQYFARQFLQEGVRIFSSAAANAIPVAEYTVAQIILAGKGFYQASRLYKEGRHAEARAASLAQPGNYDMKIGIIGAGMIGRRVISMLQAYRLEVLVFDPFLPDKEAETLGVRKTSLTELFSECQVISNHLANNAQTVGMLDRSCFSRMKENATFINTGRGAQVVEEDLVQALKKAPGRTAVLDVTMPEPVEPGHPFYSLDNVVLTPHIAGSMCQETARMGEYQMEAFFQLQKGETSVLEVTESMLSTMA